MKKWFERVGKWFKGLSRIFRKTSAFFRRLKYTYQLQKAIDGSLFAIMAEKAYVSMLANLEFNILRDNYRYFQVNFQGTENYITIEIRRNPIFTDETVETQTKEKLNECIKKQ